MNIAHWLQSDSRLISLRAPVSASDRFKLQSKRYRIGSAGIRTLWLIRNLYANSRTGDVRWAIACREQVREIELLNCAPLLSKVACLCERDDLLRLVVWLRGRCGGTIGTEAISRLRHVQDVRLRREVARTLQRLKGWHYLREMADLDRDAGVKAMASPPQRPTIQCRLERFLESAQRRRIEPQTESLFVDSNVKIQQTHPPKSVEMIRYLLKRIHQLVGRPDLKT